jgi:hypothetical protein
VRFGRSAACRLQRALAAARAVRSQRHGRLDAAKQRLQSAIRDVV